MRLSKKYILYNCIYIKLWKGKLIYNNRKQVSGYGRQRQGYEMAQEIQGGVCLFILTVVMLSQMYMCQSWWKLHLKYVGLQYTEYIPSSPAKGLYMSNSYYKVSCLHTCTALPEPTWSQCRNQHCTSFSRFYSSINHGTVYHDDSVALVQNAANTMLQPLIC